MTDLAEFLKARLDEDARVAGHGHEVWEHGLREEAGRPAALVIARGHYIAWDLPDEMAIHIARHDPARVLAEIEAKRRIMERHPGATDEDECPGCGATLMGTWQTGPGETCPELADLASVYASHDDYDESWRP